MTEYDSHGFSRTSLDKFFINQANELLSAAVPVDDTDPIQEVLDLVCPLEWDCPASNGQVTLLAVRLRNLAIIEGPGIAP